MQPIEPSELDAHLDAGLLVWLDVTTQDIDELDALGQQFGFDPAAIEDIVDIEQLPKADHYDDYLFVVLHALTTARDPDHGDRVDTLEVDCFVRPQLFVTVRATHVTGIDWLWDAVQTHTNLTSHGADELFAQLAEVIGRRYLHVIDEIEARIDDIAENALDADLGVLAEIQTLRREDATIRKVLRPQRMLIFNLRHDTHSAVSDSAGAILLDAYDVHNQVVESLASARGLLTDTLDTYRGAAAERHANAATLLTVYSAILLPLTLITGWYGMNVQRLPGAAQPRGWQIVTLVMALIAIGSWLWFLKIGLVRLPRMQRRRSMSRGVANAAKAPVRPFTMLRRSGSGPDAQRDFRNHPEAD